MRKTDALTDLIRRGRRRQVCHALVTTASLATAVALSGGILLLVLGTQILNWYWLVLLFAGSLGVGLYRLRKRMASGYKIAQEVDGRLGFHDSLSTAYYFSGHGGHASSPPELIAQQRQMAEDLARSADIGRGMPFLPPKTLYLNAALAVLACGMFGLRYGIQRSLDLRPSLVRIAFEGFLGTSQNLADAKHGQRPENTDAASEKGDARDQRASNTADQNNAPDPAEDQAQSNLDKSGDAKNKTKASGADQNSQGDDLSDMAEKEQASPEKDGAENSSNASDSNSKSGSQSPDGKNSGQSGKDADSQSLADKLRDALANMLAKLKNGSKPNQGQQQGSSQPSNSQKSGQRKNQTPDGSAKPENSEQAESNSDAESQGEQQQGGSEQSQQGKSQGNSSDRPNAPDGKSGIGNQDGDKTAREAAELAAMGKISEIIGKRAANVTGEVMVEVTSGKQQLKTQYSQKDAAHVDAGGEINRDEVPLAYQQYVQKYFDEIRKPAAPKNKPAN